MKNELPKSIQSIEKFHFNGLIELSEFDENIFIILSNPNSLPPHIGVAVDGKYFSLRRDGKDEQLEVSVLLRKSKIKSAQLVFFKLYKLDHSNLSEIKVQLENCFGNYGHVEKDGPTCLHPVLDFLSMIYDLKEENINFIYHLLFYLQRRKLISGVFCLTEDDKFKKGYYEPVLYEKSELDEYFKRIINN